MPSIYLIESDNPTVLSQAIGLVSHYPYNHLSLSLDGGLSGVYSFGRKKPNNPIIGGFIQEDFTHPFYSGTKVRIYATEITEEAFDALENSVQHFKENADAWHYNFFGLFSAFLQIPWNREHHFFCSQFVAVVLKDADLLPQTFIPSVSHPKDVIEAMDSELVYQGSLWECPLLADKMLINQ